MHDSKGEVLGATCVSVEGRFDIDVAEAYAARHAMQISMEAGLQGLILESDSLKLISHLNRGLIESSSFGFLVADILKLLSRCLVFSCKHVKRGGNKVAHKLAHLSKSFSEMRVWLWLEDVPWKLGLLYWMMLNKTCFPRQNNNNFSFFSF